MPRRREAHDPEVEERKAILQKTLDEVSLSVRIQNFLRAVRPVPVFQNVESLTRCERGELAKILKAEGYPGDIEEALDSFEEGLKEYGLELGMSEYDVEDFTKFGKFKSSNTKEE